MRQIILLIAFVTIIFQSCISESDRIFVDGGIFINFLNKTDHKFSGDVIYIGAIINNDFIVTDSLEIGNIKAKSINDTIATTTSYPLQKLDGWKPNLDKIKSKSSKGLFYVKLHEIDTPLFFNEFTFPRPTLDGVNLHIWIENGKLFVFDGIVDKQDFKVIK